jgi:hypothetical protein
VAPVRGGVEAPRALAEPAARLALGIHGRWSLGMLLGGFTTWAVITALIALSGPTGTNATNGRAVATITSHRGSSPNG